MMSLTIGYDPNAIELALDFPEICGTKAKVAVVPDPTPEDIAVTNTFLAEHEWDLRKRHGCR